MKALWLLMLIPVLFKPAHGSQRPVIKDISQKGDIVKLGGSNFGDRCKRCEVVANYGGFRYALKIKKWTDKEIATVASNIGKGELVKLTVVNDTGRSKPVKATIKTELVPTITIPRKFIKPDQVDGLLLFNREYNLSIGGKGVDTFKVHQPPTKCDANGLAFSSAEIILGKRTRFGDARIISTPQPGCQKCDPLKVGYYWEPTGKLAYQVRVTRQKVVGICSKRIR